MEPENIHTQRIVVPEEGLRPKMNKKLRIDAPETRLAETRLTENREYSPKTATEREHTKRSIQSNILVAEESLNQMQNSSRARVSVINKRYSGKELEAGVLDVNK
jgi:hypothetical protein